MSDMATELRRAQLRRDLCDWREKLATAEARVIELNKAKAPFKQVKPWQESCEYCHRKVKETEHLLTQIEEGAKPNLARLVKNWR